jgi:hypothetical protein
MLRTRAKCRALYRRLLEIAAPLALLPTAT